MPRLTIYMPRLTIYMPRLTSCIRKRGIYTGQRG